MDMWDKRIFIKYGRRLQGQSFVRVRLNKKSTMWRFFLSKRQKYLLKQKLGWHWKTVASVWDASKILLVGQRCFWKLWSAGLWAIESLLWQNECLKEGLSELSGRWWSVAQGSFRNMPGVSSPPPPPSPPPPSSSSLRSVQKCWVL